MRHPVSRWLILSLLFVFAGGGSSGLAKSIDADQLPSVLTRFDAISASEYWELVKESQEIISSLKESPESTIIVELSALAVRWESVSSVMLDDGREISLDNSYLVSVLSAKEPDTAYILGIFEALLAAHEKYPSQVFTTQDLDPLHEILARSEFQWKEESQNPISEFFNRMLREFFEWLNRIFGDRTISIEGSSSTLYTIAVIALGVVLFLVFRTLFVDFINEARLAEDNIAEELLTSESAFQKAQSLSRGGDYRAAVRFLYLSSLLLLDERGLLRYDRSKTNREYLRSVSNSPELEEPLSEVIEIFDEVWYGYHSLDEGAFKHYSDRVEELKDKKG
jgi:hypothetical protein